MAKTLDFGTASSAFTSKIKAYISGETDQITCVPMEPYWPAISADEFDLLVDAITAYPHLRQLHISNTCLGPERMQRLVTALEKQPDFGTLSFQFNKFSPETVEEIANFAERYGQLAVVDLRGSMDDGATARCLENALTQNPQKQRNLMSVTPGSPTIRALCEENKKAVFAYQKLIKSDELEQAAPQQLWEIDQRRTAILLDKEAQKPYADFIENLPALPRGQIATIDALTKEDARGFTPLDNPRTWQQRPNALEQLAAQGKLTEELLAQRTAKGATLLEYAFGYGQTAATIHSLQKQGIDLCSLLAGESAGALQVVANKGELEQLFTTEVWEHATHKQLASALRQLPEETAAQIPNRHQLLAQARMNQVAGKQAAR